MGVFHGKKRQVTMGGAVLNLTSWSLDTVADVVETTIMVSTAVGETIHWKDYTVGMLDWTAAIEALIDNSALKPDLNVDFAQDEDGIELVLYHSGVIADSWRKFTGNGIITDITVSTDLNDVAKITYSIQGSGVMTMAAYSV